MGKEDIILKIHSKGKKINFSAQFVVNYLQHEKDFYSCYVPGFKFYFNAQGEHDAKNKFHVLFDSFLKVHLKNNNLGLLYAELENLGFIISKINLPKKKKIKFEPTDLPLAFLESESKQAETSLVY